MSGPVSRLTMAAMLAAAALWPSPAAAQTTGAIPQVAVGPSGLPLPRFVSLKSGRVNLRIGPGLGYAVDWMYLKSGLPMEIVQEYDNWRRVRDSEGAEGWINQSLLSGKRTALVAPWRKGKDTAVPIHAEPRSGSSKVALLEPGVVATIIQCNGDWCEMKASGYTGWIEQTQVWGAYPGERVKD